MVFLIRVGAREIEQMLGIKMADAVGAVFILVLYMAAVAAMAVLALWTIAWIAAKIREAFKP